MVLFLFKIYYCLINFLVKKKMDGYFTEILPNIYWFYIYKSQNNQNNLVNNTVNQIQNNVKKFCVLKKIEKVIRLDTETSFWSKNKNFSIEIRRKLIELDNKKLLDYYKKQLIELKQLYYDNKKVLLISSNNIDTAIGFFLFIFKNIANMSINHSILSLKSKMKTPISLSGDMNFFIKNVLMK